MDKKRSIDVSEASRKSIVAFTVALNYSDVFRIALSSNAEQFEKWYVVTSPSNLSTLNFVNSYPNVELVLFQFKNQYVKLLLC